MQSNYFFHNFNLTLSLKKNNEFNGKNFRLELFLLLVVVLLSIGSLKYGVGKAGYYAENMICPRAVFDEIPDLGKKQFGH